MSNGSVNNSNDKSASKGTLSTSRSLLIRLRDDDDDAWSRMVDLYTPLVYQKCENLSVFDS